MFDCLATAIQLLPGSAFMWVQGAHLAHDVSDDGKRLMVFFDHREDQALFRNFMQQENQAFPGFAQADGMVMTEKTSTIKDRIGDSRVSPAQFTYRPDLCKFPEGCVLLEFNKVDAVIGVQALAWARGNGLAVKFPASRTAMMVMFTNKSTQRQFFQKVHQLIHLYGMSVAKADGMTGICYPAAAAMCEINTESGQSPRKRRRKSGRV